MFKWVCLVAALIFGTAILWIVYDLKRDVTTSIAEVQIAVKEANEAVATVNENLPAIVEEVKKGTETLSGLAQDVELIKSVAGVQNTESSRGIRSLATYADEIQTVLADETEGKEAEIWIEEVFGSDLKRRETVEEFRVGLNKEMVAIILPLAKSKQEILYRACRSGPPRRVPFFIKLPDSEPVTLEVFIKQHHEESASLPAFD